MAVGLADNRSRWLPTVPTLHRTAHGRRSMSQPGNSPPPSRSHAGSLTGSNTGSLTPGCGDAVDPDIDLQVPAQRQEWHRHRFVLPVIMLGGMLGASARYAAAEAW